MFPNIRRVHSSERILGAGAPERGPDVMKRILIVDDYVDARRILRQSLELWGYECEEVEHGSKALDALGTTKFDLVITDNEMPVMTGLQLLKRLTQKPEDQRPPVIFLSGNLTKCLRDAALRAGANAILEKPYTHEELLSTILKISHS